MGEGAGERGQFKGDGPEISGWEQGRKGHGDLGRTLLSGRGTREEGDDRWDLLVSGGASDAERALSGARCAGPCALAGRARAKAAGELGRAVGRAGRASSAGPRRGESWARVEKEWVGLIWVLGSVFLFYFYFLSLSQTKLKLFEFK
jgi:hypothetical protein